jgi:hypothetical protein
MAAYRDANATVPAHGAVAVNPSDATVFPVARGLYVGTSGNITVRMADGQDNILFTNVPVGIISIQVDKVYSTGTGATGIIALY